MNPLSSSIPPSTQGSLSLPKSTHSPAVKERLISIFYQNLEKPEMSLDQRRLVQNEHELIRYFLRTSDAIRPSLDPRSVNLDWLQAGVEHAIHLGGDPSKVRSRFSKWLADHDRVSLAYLFAKTIETTNVQVKALGYLSTSMAEAGNFEGSRLVAEILPEGDVKKEALRQLSIEIEEADAYRKKLCAELSITPITFSFTKPILAGSFL